jgi:CRP/FNR family transcriptional regulator, dissimilatory nitrate respiration regulator
MRWRRQRRGQCVWARAGVCDAAGALRRADARIGRGRRAALCPPHAASLRNRAAAAGATGEAPRAGAARLRPGQGGPALPRVGIGCIIAGSLRRTLTYIKATSAGAAPRPGLSPVAGTRDGSHSRAGNMDTDRFWELRGHRLLATLDDAQLLRVAQASQFVTLSPGQLLFQRGEPAHRFFIVVEGQVKLCIQSRSGDEKIVEVLSPGQPFAEALMFAESPAFPVACVAIEATTVVGIPNAEYLAILRGSPDACLRLLADLSQRLHFHIREIEALALENCRNRLINHLIGFAGVQSGAASVTLDETKRVLASRLAIKPETLSRTLRALAAEGLIRVDGRIIHIADVDALRRQV